jgi:hypothetical protein
MADKTSETPTFISDDHLKAIGNLVAHWGWLELRVQTALWLLLRISKRDGYILTTHMGLVSLVDALMMLSVERFGARHKRSTELGKILARIEPLRIERNNIVHNVWLAKSSGPEIADSMKISARGKLKFERKQRTARDIDKVTDEVCEVVRDLHSYLARNYPKKVGNYF